MSAEAFADHIPAIVTATTAAVSIFTGLATLGWWMARQFQGIRDSTALALNAHEKLDQLRMEETLRRFESVQSDMVSRAEKMSERFEKIMIAQAKTDATLERMEKRGH